MVPVRKQVRPHKKHAAGWEDERYGNPIAEDKKAVREWVKDPANQAVLEEIGKIEVGRLFDYVWNANYLRGDNHQYSFSSGRTSDTWIAGLSGEDAEKKYGVASFEMSLENDYGRIQHQTRFWEQGEGKRNEALTTTIGKQKPENTSLSFASTCNTCPIRGKMHLTRICICKTSRCL